ncbi:MAG TPA: hypothetical protein VFX16_13920 [Pseudonocardiaceae bacterium]|nr:hypothetical protein [Pseudonocardiaceae bacterium]
MFAIIAAVLFALAVIFDLAGFSLGVITAGVLVDLGLLCVALHLAGIGTETRSLNWRRSRRRR